MAMGTHDGYTYELSDTQKAKNLLARLEQAKDHESARNIAINLLDKWGEIGFEFLRDLNELVWDAEQEAYERTPA